MKKAEEKWRGVDVLYDEVKKELEQLSRLAEGMNDRRIQLPEAEGFTWDVHAYLWEL